MRGPYTLSCAFRLQWPLSLVRTAGSNLCWPHSIQLRGCSGSGSSRGIVVLLWLCFRFYQRIWVGETRAARVHTECILFEGDSLNCEDARKFHGHCGCVRCPLIVVKTNFHLLVTLKISVIFLLLFIISVIIFWSYS